MAHHCYRKNNLASPLR
jgi:hypothetical protein